MEHMDTWINDVKGHCKSSQNLFDAVGILSEFRFPHQAIYECLAFIRLELVGRFVRGDGVKWSQRNHVFE